MKETNNYYVDPVQLLVDVKEYQQQLAVDALTGKHTVVSDSLVNSIMKIATKLSYRYNFINYSYRQDMVSDGMMACLQGIKKFDAEKFDKAFPYLTQCCFWAFTNRIKIERKEQYIKSKLVSSYNIDEFSIQGQDADEEFENSYVEFIRAHSSFDGSFFEKKKEKKVKPLPMDDFCE